MLRCLSLTINRIGCAHLQLELHPGWRDREPELDFSSVTVRQRVKDSSLLQIFKRLLSALWFHPRAVGTNQEPFLFLAFQNVASRPGVLFLDSDGNCALAKYSSVRHPKKADDSEQCALPRLTVTAIGCSSWVLISTGLQCTLCKIKIWNRFIGLLEATLPKPYIMDGSAGHQSASFCKEACRARTQEGALAD